MITKYTLMIGLNDKNTYRQELTTLEALKRVQNIIGDCTVQEGKGIYTHANGTQVLETTLIITVLDFAGSWDVETVCATLKTALNQESIAVVREMIDSRLY